MCMGGHPWGHGNSRYRPVCARACNSACTCASRTGPPRMPRYVLGADTPWRMCDCSPGPSTVKARASRRSRHVHGQVCRHCVQTLVGQAARHPLEELHIDAALLGTNTPVARATGRSRADVDTRLLRQQHGPLVHCADHRERLVGCNPHVLACVRACCSCGTAYLYASTTERKKRLPRRRHLAFFSFFE